MAAGGGYTLALMNEAIRPGPENPQQALRVCCSFRSSSPPSTSATTSPRCSASWRRRSQASPGKSSSSTTIPPTAPGRWCASWRAQDSRVRCIRRIGRRGLSGACIEGILASSAPYAAVMDADLQHDETQLPKMLALLQSGQAELVVGSRYIEGGSADSFNKQRAGASALATEVAKRVLRVEHRRSHERLLHDPPRPLRATGAAALDAGLQDPARHRRDRARQAAHGRNSLYLRLAAAWREQARFHGRAGFPGPGAGEADQRHGVAALPAVRDGRRHRAGRASRDALRQR